MQSTRSHQPSPRHNKKLPKPIKQQLSLSHDSTIAYSLFPVSSLNSKTTVHPKSIKNLYNSNFQTLAYEKFTLGKQPQTQQDRNFVKNYYLENITDKVEMTNMIVKQLQDQTYMFNAYNLAENATKNYYQFQNKRIQFIKSTRERAKKFCTLYVKQRKQAKQDLINNRTKWIQKILVAIEQLGEKMFKLKIKSKQEQDNSGKQRIFMNQKAYVNVQYLKQYKVHDPIQSKIILQELRAIMVKKKSKFEDQKIMNRNLNSSNLTSGTETSINSSSQSMISIVSEAQRSQNQQQVINKLCDFDELKKKWKIQDVERIKDLVLFTLTKRNILKMEGEYAVRLTKKVKQNQSIQINHNLSKENINTNNIIAKHTKSTPKQPKSRSNIKKQLIDKQSLFLSKHQSQTKQKLTTCDKFQPIGSKYQKIKNYGKLFTSREKDMKLELSLVSEEGMKKEEKGKFDKSVFNLNRTVDMASKRNTHNNTMKQIKSGYKTTRLTLRN